jgi:hypothetical protein
VHAAFYDEAYTYNRRVNHAPPVALHFMILKALTKGVRETRLAAALNVDVLNIRRKRDMLNGVCPEALSRCCAAERFRRTGLVYSEK